MPHQEAKSAGDTPRPRLTVGLGGGGGRGSLALSAKMAAALTPSYVLQSQPCPHHLTARNRGRSAAGSPGGSAGLGGGRGAGASPAPGPQAAAAGASPGPAGLVAGLNDFPQPPPRRHLGSLPPPTPPFSPTPARGH